ncbi:hypothetical protein EN803_39470, partial [Mesorhizobium sp. M2D.F.Ca.ET.160.01.1.1]
PCESGLRYKHCHGRFNTSATTDKGIEQQLAERGRIKEAEEMLRKRQQGHGRPMITALHNGRRVVVVGKRMVYSPLWRFVTDFLLDNLKNVIGRWWGDEASKKTP